MRRIMSLMLVTVMVLGLFPAMPAQAADTPVITEVSPSIVPAEGGDIMINGTNLGAAGTKVVLQIGAEIVIMEGDSIRLVSPHMIVVTVPEHEVDATGVKQVNSLVVSNDGGSSVPKVNPFKYMETPVVKHSYLLRPFPNMMTAETHRSMRLTKRLTLKSKADFLIGLTRFTSRKRIPLMAQL